jgi:predicted acyltransferase
LVKSAHHHLESLDAFRGITIAGMILVNNPGNWDRVYAPLLHADWDGCTLADLVYPFFLVILGVALPFALSRRRESGHQVRRLYARFVRRAALLFALGFVLNLVAVQFSWPTVRIPGVLQRIAIVYLFAALITLHVRLRARAVIAAALLIGHWLVLRLAPLTPKETIAAVIDRAVFGAHILAPVGDPEGLLGTMSATASALIGSVAGEWMRTASTAGERIRGLATGGAALVGAGVLWSFALPLNKPLWTGSYALFTAGLALLAFAWCFWAIDVRHVRGWARPFVWLGLNPLAVYFLSELVGHILDLTNAKTVIYWGWLRPMAMPTLSDTSTSFVFALLTVTMWTVVAGVMYRRGVRVQV